MFEKVKKVLKEHGTEIVLGLALTGLAVEIIAVTYVSGVVDGVKIGKNSLPNDLAVKFFEEGGKSFMQINGKTFAKVG